MHAHVTSEPPHCSFELFSSILSLATREKKSQALSPLRLLRKLWRGLRCPLSLLFTRVHNLKSLGNLIGHSFQPCPRLCCPPLDAFKNVYILQISCSPEPRTVLKMKLLNTIHTAGMFWACCQATPLDPFLQGCSPSTPIPINTCAQYYFIPGAESGIRTH